MDTLFRIGLLVAVIVVEPMVAHAQAFDGTYTGALVLKTNNANGRGSCQFVDNNRTLTVTQNQVTMVFYAPANSIEKGTVGPDGSVTAYGPGPGGGSKLTGKIQGNTLTAEIVTSNCVWTIQMKK